ncbi:MAG: glycosyltransferase family 2 protein, partial [Hyphomicrobiaceae bacterium]
MSSPSPQVSIIVVSYNTKSETLACLASVAKETPALAHELIVVDNNSPDGSAEAIAQACPGARLHALKDNLGFARANNLAALEARGEYLLLLNPDTVVLDRAIERLAAFAENTPGAGIWGGRTLFGNLKLDPTSAWRRMTPWSLFCRASGLSAALPRSRFFNSEEMPDWDRSSEREVDIVTGCFLLIRRELWQRLGGFDPVFFMYGEEADLCLRARQMGARPRITPTSTIIHLGGASE